MTNLSFPDELRARTRSTLDRLRQELLDQRTPGGHWVGQLSSSALSTATAVSAISAMVAHTPDSVSAAERSLVSRGIVYLRGQQNADGGFGDTDRSHSNIATSYLVLAASALSETAVGERLDDDALARLRAYIDAEGGIEGLRRRYGTDKTFVVPIMTNMAIAGLIAWNEVARLPFEAAVFPQSMYRLLKMPVVSYAIPALVAIGQTRHFHGRKTFLPWRMVRSAAIAPSMRVLERMQPASGGYLEATPLTSFVVMSLAATGRGDHGVCKNGVRFLSDSILEDGSWPIDTNLATWVTSLAIDALASDPNDNGEWFSEQLAEWHLSCQHLTRHPYTGAEPGGWGWTDLSGAVPDSDDTPAAILAIERMQKWCRSIELVDRMNDATRRGRQWLLKLQNRNGGWPTFCRGWGKLPFDRSSTDLTAHAIRALSLGTGSTDSRSVAAIEKGRRFLFRSQQPSGSWLPLWFGNQDRPDEDNPVYGTAKTLMAGHQLKNPDARQGAITFLLKSQNSDGGWGGGPSVTDHWSASATGPFSSLEPVFSTIEETALAVDALATDRLATVVQNETTLTGSGGNPRQDQAIIHGVEFLLESVDQNRHHVSWPIGFYFAKLWYYERLYPLIFTAAALGKALQVSEDTAANQDIATHKDAATSEDTATTLPFIPPE